MKSAYEQAVELINQFPELQDFVGKRDSSLVDWAEKTLDVVFPPSYRRFLLDYGAGSFGSVEFYGIIDDNLDKSAVPDGIWLNLIHRQYGLAHQLFCVYGVEFKYYLVTGKNADEETAVLTWDGYPRENEITELETAAPSFGEFFLVQVKEAIAFHTSEPAHRRSKRGYTVDLEALFKTAFEDE